MICFFSFLGISGQFPSEYVTAVVSGQALGGVFTAIIEIVTITFASDPRSSALIFFTIGNILLVLSLVAYILMAKTKFFKYFTTDRSGALSPKNSRLQLQRQPSTMEPVFRDVLNKMWLYGFTEWLVCAFRFKNSSQLSLFFISNLFSSISGICCDSMCVSVGDSVDKFPKSWNQSSLERCILRSGNKLFDFQLGRLFGSNFGWFD